MLPSPDGVFETSDRERTITIRALAGVDRRVHLSLAGEIDLAATAALSSTVDWLRTLTPISVLIDLSELSFACATLPNFIVRIRQFLSSSAEIVLWRPQPEIQKVLLVTDMATIATLRDEPASPPPCVPDSTRGEDEGCPSRGRTLV
ncbi:STAS domain-containing protein [Paractinoplanes toevensis]|uniref:STAS domain-containing protein n=1 Tax=Paractinoplanes toevensis TaxID=571911 RepID=A0A919WDC2_9ACTN|nr:STAS domain-containing protein [Actinoplanes toevensis]GIM98076.1 hypothetical protein Ato02nite_098690 [Actinoplanes toevensis]